MVRIDARELDYAALNEAVRSSRDDCEIINCLGQRFIGAGLSDKKITITGTPGNALGAYLNGADITVYANAQDAVGDTMNNGTVTVHGSIGDAAGYAMRGGAIYVKGNAGYRAGIHMKAYREKIPALVIGGCAGSFLGEYQAGGLIIVLGLGGGDIVGNFPCTGMHGGKMLLRSDCARVRFPAQVQTRRADDGELEEASAHIRFFCDTFGYDLGRVMSAEFTAVVPDSANPYKQMYVAN